MVVAAAAANVLVVDDRDDVIQNVRDAFQSCADITVMTAQGVAEAEVLLRDHFFVAAFIDLYIVEPGDAGQAQELVRFIQDWRPTAKAILVTENEQTGWHHLLDFVDTTRGSVSSIWRRTTGMPYAD